MEKLFDAMKTKDEVKSFTDNPKKYITDKLLQSAKDKLKDATFGPEMSPEMSDLFKRVADKHDSNPKRGACPNAAHGNASNILFDLKYNAQTTWLPKTSLKIIGSIWTARSDLKDFIKNKTKAEIKDKMKEYFDGIPIETFKDKGSKQGCDFTVVATIDYGKKLYEVIMVGDCHCKSLRIPLTKKSGRVKGWKLYASGSLQMKVNKSFIKAKMGRVKKYKFEPSCDCSEEGSNIMFDGSGSKVAEKNKKAKEFKLTCDQLAKLIADTEKNLDQTRKMIKDIKKRSKDKNGTQGLDDIANSEVKKLNSEYNLKALFMEGLLSEWKERCNNKKPNLNPLEFAYFTNALLKFNQGRYRDLKDEKEIKKHDDRLKAAAKKEKSNSKKEEEEEN